MPSLFKRISDVINANLNDLIDRVEDPERMIKQIIREMEDNISRAKEGVVEAIASEKQLQKDLEHHRRQSAEWLKKAEEAVQTNNEELARAALTRKKEHDHLVETLESSWEAARNTSARLKAQLQAVGAKLEETRRKRSTLVARQRAAEAQQHMDKTLVEFQAGQDAHANFTRMEDKVAAMEAKAEAWAELNSAASSLERDVRSMEVAREVDNELDALKKKVQNSNEQ
jgi:phage shock protein A